MRTLSNSQKSKILHRIYTVIKFFDKDAEIERDSLHSIYEVNKYGIRVKFDQKKVRILKNKMIAKLCEEFDLFSKEPVCEDRTAFYSNIKKDITITVNEQDMKYFGQDELLVDINVH